MNYFKKLMNSSSPESSKRYMAMNSFHFLLIISIYATITKTVIDPNIYYVFGGLAMGTQITTLFNNKPDGK